MQRDAYKALPEWKVQPEFIKTSLAAHIHQDWMQNVPLYGFLRWLQKQA